MENLQDFSKILKIYNEYIRSDKLPFKEERKKKQSTEVMITLEKALVTCFQLFNQL